VVAYHLGEIVSKLVMHRTIDAVTFSGPSGEFFVANDAGVHTPTLNAAGVVNDLASTPADYVIISHGKFIGDTLNRLVEARESSGLRVRVVDVREIYETYSGGEVTPFAIARYIEELYTRHQLQYALLVGDDSYDYRGNGHRKSRSYVPSFYQSAGEHINHATVDATYGDVDEDSLPEVAVGRLPVRTLRQLNRVINKTLQYERDGDNRHALLTADSIDDASRHSFKKDSNRLRRAIGDTFSTTTAYIDSLDIQDARTRILRTIESGARLTSYIGHSDRGQWSFDNLLSRKTIRELGNVDSPTVVTQFGCWNNDYSHPSKQSIGETFLVATEAGAAASIGMTTLTGIRNEARFAELLYVELSVPGMSLGRAMNRARRQLANEFPVVDVRDVLIGSTLLGDPALVPNQVLGR